jgi:hypothetical protein
MKVKLQYLSVVTAIALLTGCNSNSSSNSSSSSSVSGTAIDGYISGATVCADINGNGTCDSDEPSTTTDSTGNFTLEGENVDNVTLLLSGGTDIGTGLAFEGQMTAPMGSTTITPLTTMIQSLVEQGDSLEDAEATVKDSLGISSDIDLKNYDPIDAVNKNPNDDKARKVLEEQTKVQILISNISSTVNGLVQSGDLNEHINSTFNSIANGLKKNKESLDLTDSTFIEDLITDSASNSSEETLDSSMKTVIAQKMIETISQTSRHMQQSSGTAILDRANAGLNIAIDQVSKVVESSIKNNDISEISKLDVKDKLDKKLVKNELYNISFNSVDVPLTDESQGKIITTNSISINGVSQNLSFNILRSTGDSDNNEIFGLAKDYQDKPIVFDDGTPYICNGTNAGVGSGLDHSTILQKNGKLYMVNQFECSIGSMYMFELEQNSVTGVLLPKENTLQYISQKDEFGGFTHCAGMPTPWQSHLGSEEYEPDAKVIATGQSDTYYDEVNKYWGGDSSQNNPYYYGWTPEVIIDSNGTPNYKKHYSMGRFSHELSYVMPDKKTVYLTDDDTNVGLYMFIADNEQDLSSGTLYAAKFNQTQSYKGGSFDLQWIDLGHATDSEIKEEISKQLTFSDIFDEVELNSDNTCASGYTAINTRTGAECLKIKDGMEKIASRLETRRYAAIKGATTELRKEEGITYDPIHNKLYVAISEIARGMEDNKKYGVDNDEYDKAGNNDIRLPNNSCGGVYALDLNKDITIGSDYIAQNFYAILVGEPTDYEGTKYEGNTCNVDKIASPDNVTYIANSNTLLIGEDTSAHKNNMVWSYNVETGDLDRIATLPIGAEATSPYWYQDVNGFSYQTLVTQHPSVGSKESSIGVLGPVKNASYGVELEDSQVDEIVIPDYKTPGVGDVEGEIPPCYSSAEGLVYKSNFECKSLLPWSTFSTASNNDWEVSSYGGAYYAYISGYGADEASNDWLISPKFNLSGDEILRFKSAKGYSGPDLQLLISENYTGAGDPELATWVQLEATWANTDSGNYVWTSSGDIDLSAYAGKTVYFAFRQVAQGTASGEVANWEIDNFIVSGSGEVIVPFTSEAKSDKTEGITTITELNFSATVSGGEKPLSFYWNFDGSNTSNVQNPTFTFAQAGDYTVNLTITDANSNTTTSSINISVAEPLNELVPAKIGDLRIATFNSYLNRESLGALKTELEEGTNEQIKNVAQIIQRVNPDVLLLQEFDYNGTEQVQTFIDKYLNVAQAEDTNAISYPYFYTSTVNTGTQPDTPVDFNNDGKTGTADDAFGFGEFEGQYGMVLFSKYPIDTENIRTFQTFLWKDMPEAYIPMNIDGSDYYSQDELNIFRLSSKSHWDIPVNVDGTIVNVLASHPTPPVFDDGDTDGANDNETNNVIDWNGKRNHDEIRLWADYVEGNASYLYDDNGITGGLEDNTRFVIMGDQNADSNEGDAFNGAINQLLLSNSVNAITPTSKGALDEELDADDTAGWGLRADYVLPSSYGFSVNQSGVYWPRKNDVNHYLVETKNGSENSSDHRLVWTDLTFFDGNSNEESVETINETFNGSLGNWTPISLSSDKDWAASSYSGVPFAKASGYKGNENSNDWLISPKINFTGKQVLTFDSATKYDGPVMKIKISTDFDGTNVESATWTELSGILSNGDFTWVSSGDIDLSSYTTEGYIAFHYTSDDSGSATWEVTNVILEEPLPSTINETFNGSLGNWTPISLSSDKDWAASSYSGVPFAKASGYKGNENSNDWLISPKINFTGKQVLTFDSATKYDGPVMKIKISTDFDGTNVESATWTELSGILSNGDFTWVSSGDIDLSSYTTEGYIAFHYTSDDSGSATWEVTNVILEDSLTTEEPIDNGNTDESSSKLIISEIADPDGNDKARFIELYNLSTESIDLSNYSLQRWTNGNVDPQSPVKLSGTIAANDYFVIATDLVSFKEFFGFDADLAIGTGGPADSNGDDNIAILDDFNNIIDMFGVAGEDGSGTTHEFEDGSAQRKVTAYKASTTWIADDWEINNDSGIGSALSSADDFTPGEAKKN